MKQEFVATVPMMRTTERDQPVYAEFLPLDSACEEHTCPWNFAEGGRVLGPSIVHLRNASGLSILSGRKMMVSYDALDPGGRVALHAQTPFVQSDVERLVLCVGELTLSGAEVKFGSKGSCIDQHTDSGVQRVPVGLKGKTFGLTIRKTDAWIIPENSDPAPRAVVASRRRDRQSRTTQPRPSSTGSRGGTEARRDSRHAARARSTRPCSILAEVETVWTTARRGRTRERQQR